MISITPLPDNLFDVGEKNKAAVLPEELAVLLHCTTTQLVFLAMRARKDLLTAVSFLTTIVKSPDIQDWLKQKGVLQYMRGTRLLELQIELDNLQVMMWFMDSAHMVHGDCRGRQEQQQHSERE